MEDESFNRFRVSFMQDVLPLGLAMVQRIRNGGAGKVIEVFTTNEDPLNELRVEGESAAKDLRERLDKVSPGLGNPVMEVSVNVDVPQDVKIQDEDSLKELLNKIEHRLDNLKQLLALESADEVSPKEQD